MSELRLAAYWAKAAHVPASTAELDAVTPPLSEKERAAAIRELARRAELPRSPRSPRSEERNG